MGFVTATFSVSNPRDPAIPAIAVDALADTGAMNLCLPARIVAQLKLEELEQREVTLADGGRHRVPYVGPVKVGFGQRGCFTGAFVLGERVLVGAIPLEDMDLVIDPARRRVTVNPASPEIPSAIVMHAGARRVSAGQAREIGNPAEQRAQLGEQRQPVCAQRRVGVVDHHVVEEAVDRAP